MNKKQFDLNNEIANKIERENYIYLSYKSFLSILAREFAESKSTETADMIEKYRIEYQNHYINLSIYIKELTISLLGYLPEKYKYNFDFNNLKVEFIWD